MTDRWIDWGEDEPVSSGVPVVPVVLGTAAGCMALIAIVLLMSQVLR
ncbi:hypothetical protein [Mycolicibacterium sphagni]|nr:hypothetical protein [Mycolicibacterium sphagni]MCV7174874.1 hypothetical protein [Mycolicibacterium sphagni]